MKYALYKVRNRAPLLLYHNVKARILGEKIRYPFAVQYNITYRCNLKCVYCDCGTTKHTNYEMTTKEICRMVDEFVAMGTRRLSITGGEPLLKENLPEIVNHARKRGLTVSVATNGVLIPKKIDALSNVSIFNISLDGPEELNDLQRGSGTYQKIVEAVKIIKKRSIPVYLNCVLTSHNCHRIEELLLQAKDLGVKLLVQPVFYAKLSHANIPDGYEKLKCEQKAMADTLERLIQLKETNDPTLILSKKYYQALRHYLETGTKMKCTFAKKQGAVFCTVSPEGHVTPCNLLVRDKQYLNGNEIGFKRAFLEIPELTCGGCISSFIDFDYLLTLDQAVLGTYVRNYLAFQTTRLFSVIRPNHTPAMR